MAPMGRPDRGKKPKEKETKRTAPPKSTPEKRTEETDDLTDFGKKKNKKPEAEICEAPIGKPRFN